MKRVLLMQRKPVGTDSVAYLVSAKPWPHQRELVQKARVLMGRVFDGAVPGRQHPRAIVTIGVMGSGKSTAVRGLARGWAPAIIDPDAVAVQFLGGGPLPAGGSLYELASKWTARIYQHAVAGRYNIVYDSPVPSERLLASMHRAGYSIDLLLVRASVRAARSREVTRDLARGWGRVGVSEAAHARTQGSISQDGPRLAMRYADRLIVCDNTGVGGMRCRDMGDPRRQSELALAQFFRP